MGSLSKLLDTETTVNMLLTSSDLAYLYVYDTLKGRCKATLESVLLVDSKASFKAMSEMVSMQPNLADKWLVEINYSKVKAQLKATLGILQSETAVYLIRVRTYSEYKEVKELYAGINDLYLNVIKRQEVMDLLRPFRLSEDLKGYVASAYYNDPERVFVLRKELQNGAEVKNSKDVAKLCGESMGTVQRFAIQLLSDEPKTEMFLKRSYKKRVKTVCDLCDSFTSRSAYNFLSAVLKDILYIKMLYLQGVIYNRIEDLPEAFDEGKLAKYGYYLKDISEGISYERILWVYSELRNFGRWNTSQDAVSFLYKFYLALIKKAEAA